MKIAKNTGKIAKFKCQCSTRSGQREAYFLHRQVPLTCAHTVKCKQALSHCSKSRSVSVRCSYSVSVMLADRMRLIDCSGKQHVCTTGKKENEASWCLANLSLD